MPDNTEVPHQLNNAELESHAWKWVINFGGSMLILAFSLKQVGIDFTPVMQAISARMVEEIKYENAKRTESLSVSLETYERRIRELELVSHEAHVKTK